MSAGGPAVCAKKKLPERPYEARTDVGTQLVSRGQAGLKDARPEKIVADRVGLAAGIAEGYIEVTDYGPGGAPESSAVNCQGAIGTKAFPVYYTIRVVAGTSSYTLPDNNGPNLASGGGVNKPSPTVCTAAQNSAALGASSPGDSYTVRLIGFDYPMYAASYPNSSGNRHHPFPAPTDKPTSQFPHRSQQPRPSTTWGTLPYHSVSNWRLELCSIIHRISLSRHRALTQS